MVGDEDRRPLLDPLRDPLRARLRALLPLLLPVLPKLKPQRDKWAEWLVEARFKARSQDEIDEWAESLARVRERVLDRAVLEEDDIVLDVGAGTGLLVFGALGRLGPDGGVVALDISVDCLEELRAKCDDPRVSYLVGSAEVLPLPDESVDAVLTRSVLIYVREKAEAAREFFRVSRPGGRLSIFEPVNRRNTQVWELFDFGDLEGRVIADFRRRWPPDHPMLDFDVGEMERWFAAAGFQDLAVETHEDAHPMTAGSVLHGVGAPGCPSLVEAWREAFTPEEIERLVATVEAAEPVQWKVTVLYLSGRKP
ncbi:MAG TPA: methyltransferase domain-containing protein [Gaiellaceae bacterium]|nr:methyltransferase domain-containing protein [Gaiellaceae bacterium]